MKRDLDALEARPSDLLIVGAGIVGAAAAWDAAQRGLSVALVDAGDFGAATSWNSLKTIHGGLRHLQRLDVAGLRESVRERRALLRIAPALVAPLTFVVPCHGHGPRGREAFLAASVLYNLLSRDRNAGLPEHRRLEGARLLPASQAVSLVPGLGGARMTGALQWQDAQVDRPERLLLAFVHAAAGQGALCANYVEATELVRDSGRVAGARLRDTSGRSLTVRAEAVLVAVGAGLDPLLQRSGLRPTGQPWLAAINVVLRRTPPPVAVGGDAGGRALFLVPWREHTMLGTDYAPPEAPLEERLETLLRDGARAFPGFTLRREDVSLIHRGQVPGREARALATHDRLLDHTPGLHCAIAAKYTTARALAERAVDRVVATLTKSTAPCRTATTPLPLPAAEVSFEQEVRRAVREEMALHLADVVLRRTDLGTTGRPPDETLARAAAVMAEERGWEAGEREAEHAALRRWYADRTATRVE